MSINLDNISAPTVSTLVAPVQNRPPVHGKVCRYVDAYYNHNHFNDCCNIKSCKNGKITLVNANKHMVKYHRDMIDNYTQAPSEEIKSLFSTMTIYDHACTAKLIPKPRTLDGSTRIIEVIDNSVNKVLLEDQDKLANEAREQQEAQEAQDKLAKEKIEQEEIAREKTEREKTEREAQEKTEREKTEREKTEREAREKTERERIAAEDKAKEAAELKAKEAKRIHESRYSTIILNKIYIFFMLLSNMTYTQAGDLLKNVRSVELVTMLLRIVVYMMTSTILFMLMSICTALPSVISPILSFMMIVNCIWISMILVCISSIYTIVFSIYVWKMLNSHEHPLL